jgi:uncharacterized protein YjbI with pentapeptide repeats
MKCQYNCKTFNFSCDEESWQNSSYCILHTDFPNDESSAIFDILLKEKKKKIEEKVKNKDFEFSGAILSNVNLPRSEINTDINFLEAKIIGNVNFNGSNITGNVNFQCSKIGGRICFDSIFESKKTKITGSLHFQGAEIGLGAFFRNIVITKNVKFDSSHLHCVLRFNDSKIGGDVWLFGSTFKNFIDFGGATIGNLMSSGSVFDRFVFFNDSKFEGITTFQLSTFKDYVHFERAKFFGDTRFEDIEFHSKVSFFNSSFLSNRGRFKRLQEFDANFESAKLNNVYFRHCDLTNVRFKDVIFENCELSTSKLPVKIIEHKEYDCSKGLINNSIIPKLNPKMTKIENVTIFAPFSLIEYANEVSDIYRRIRQCLENQGAYIEAGEFYKKEMDLRRTDVYKDTNYSIYLTYKFLSLTSRYGENSKILASLIVLYYLAVAVFVFILKINPTNPYFMYFNIAIIPIGSFLIALFVYSFARKMAR